MENKEINEQIKKLTTFLKRKFYSLPYSEVESIANYSICTMMQNNKDFGYAVQCGRNMCIGMCYNEIGIPRSTAKSNGNVDRMLEDASNTYMLFNDEYYEIEDEIYNSLFVEEILNILPERDRYIIKKYYIDNIPMKQIGCELNCTKSYIKQRLVSILNRIRRYLEAR